MKDLADLNLNLLLALDALLAEVNVTRAANRLGVTQPAMSRSLQKLREHLGDDLLVRSSRGFVRTPRAERIFGSLRHGLEALRRALAQESQFAPEQSNRAYRLATRDVMGVWVLPRLMAYLRIHAPGTSLSIVSAEQDVFVQLDSGALDMSLCVGFADIPGVKRRLLFRDTWVCLVRIGHPALSAGIDLDGYIEYPHALSSPKGEGLGVVDVALAKLGRTRHIAYRTSYFVGAAMAVAQTDMILTMPRRPGEQLASMLNLLVHEPPIELEPLDVQAIWHERMDDDPAHHWLRQALASIC